MKKLIVGFLIGTALTGSVASASGRLFKEDAQINCTKPLTEDTAANVHLIKFSDGEIVYRCGRVGF